MRCGAEVQPWAGAAPPRCRRVGGHKGEHRALMDGDAGNLIAWYDSVDEALNDPSWSFTPAKRSARMTAEDKRFAARLEKLDREVSAMIAANTRLRERVKKWAAPFLAMKKR